MTNRSTDTQIFSNSRVLFHNQQSGLILLNIIISILIISVLLIILMNFTQPKIDDLVIKAVQRNHSMLSAGIRSTHLVWAVKGSPSEVTVIDVNGIPVKFKDGYLFDVMTNEHFPAGYVGPDNLSARVWYLLMNEVVTPSRPPGLIDAGWEMTDTSQCVSSSHVCWKYFLAGNVIAKMEYKLGQRNVTLTINELELQYRDSE